MTSATGETIVAGDPTNAQGFKDGSGVVLTPADVIWTGFTTNDTSAPSGTSTLNLSARDFLTFKKMTIIGGTAGSGPCVVAAAGSVSITFEDVLFIASAQAEAVRHTSTADVASVWVFNRCIFSTSISIILTRPSAADFDYDIQIKNCLFPASAGNVAINITATGANSFNGGGVDVFNCSFYGVTTAVQTGANTSTTVPGCNVYNSLMFARSAALSANASGQIVEDYNAIYAATARTNVSTGSNSVSGAPPARAPLLEWGQHALFGRLARMFLQPAKDSPLLGFGAQAGGPTVDFFNRTRASGGASLSYAVGAMERHDFAVKETSTVDAGGVGIKIVGPGDHDIKVPVDASSTTITVRARYDTTHAATTKPQAILLANAAIGVSTETKTMTAAADTWETLTFSSFTPSAKGVVTIRLVSRPDAGGGIAFFDTVTQA